MAPSPSNRRKSSPTPEEANTGILEKRRKSAAARASIVAAEEDVDGEADAALSFIADLGKKSDTPNRRRGRPTKIGRPAAPNKHHSIDMSPILKTQKSHGWIHDKRDR